MDTVSVNKFRESLKSFVEQVVSRHEPLKVTRRAGEDFVVLRSEDPSEGSLGKLEPR